MGKYHGEGGEEGEVKGPSRYDGWEGKGEGVNTLNGERSKNDGKGKSRLDSQAWRSKSKIVSTATVIFHEEAKSRYVPSVI